MTIFCNVKTCFFWEKLDAPHSRSLGRGVVPIGNTAQYGGRCSLDMIKMVYHHFSSTRGLKQEIAVCGNFSETKIPVDSATKCNVFHCLWNTAPKRGEPGTCEKIKDYPIYVDFTTVFNGDDKEIHPKCSSISNRESKGHIDWAAAAHGYRSKTSGILYKRDFEPQREKIIGSH